MSDEETVKEIIEELGTAFEIWGFKPILGQIWAALYFNGEMTQDELKKNRGVGLSTISDALATLLQLGSIKITKKKGRKNVYSAETNFHEIMRKRMDTALRYHIEPINSLLNNKVATITNQETKNKVSALKNRYSKMSTLIKLILKINQK